jgi:hypothetical protein
MKKAVIAVCVFMASAASAADVDWKFYGSAENKQHCFYDSIGASRQSDGHMRVWTKCLSEDEMDASGAKDNVITNRTADKIKGGYVPPIIRFIDFPFDQIIAVVLYEQIADVGLLEPTARIYWELACSEKMIRLLDLSARNGIRGSVRGWEYVAPETNADRLLKMLCRQ